MFDSFGHSIELARFAHAQLTLFIFDPKLPTLLGTGAGAEESLGMLDGLLYSFDYPALSSSEQGRARTSKVACCSVKC